MHVADDKGALGGLTVRRLVQAILLCGLLTLANTHGTPAAADSDDDAKGIAYFQKHIRPVLVKQCYECHSVKHNKAESGLRVDSRKAIRAGGDRGAAVTPEDVEDSLILTAMSYQDEDLEMPPEGKLDDEVIAKFKKWIEMGAPDPRDKPDAK